MRSQLQKLLELKNFQEAKALLRIVRPPDIADTIGELPEAMQVVAFRLLPKDEAIEVYEHLKPNSQRSLLPLFPYL